MREIGSRLFDEAMAIVEAGGAPGRSPLHCSGAYHPGQVRPEGHFRRACRILARGKDCIFMDAAQVVPINEKTAAVQSAGGIWCVS